MRGSHGLAFIIFSVLVWLTRWAGIGVFQEIDPKIMQAIALLGLFGVALLLMRGIVRMIVQIFFEDHLETL